MNNFLLHNYDMMPKFEVDVLTFETFLE